MSWINTAYAMSGTGAAGGGEAAGFASFVPLILMFAVFYFLLIRPQQKRAKEHKSMLSALKRGDEVITSGGLFGRIAEAGEEYLIVDLGETKVKVSRGHIAGVVGSAKPAVEKKSKKADEATKDSSTDEK